MSEMSEMSEMSVERYREMNEEDLALAAKGGDREARNVLFTRLEETIAGRLRPAKRLLRELREASGPIEAEDIEQQAFVIFCSLLDNWQPERRLFVQYLTATMRWDARRYVQSCLHVRSKRIRLVRMLGYNGQQAHERPEEKAGPAELVESAEQWEGRVAQLTDSGRRFVSSRFYEGLSTDQIAHANHCSTRTVNRSLRAALDLLRHNSQEELEAV